MISDYFNYFKNHVHASTKIMKYFIILLYKWHKRIQDTHTSDSAKISETDGVFGVWLNVNITLFRKAGV